MAAQKAGYEAQRRAEPANDGDDAEDVPERGTLDILDRSMRFWTYINRSIRLYRGTCSSEYSERFFINGSIDGYMSKNASIDEVPRKYPNDVLPRYIPRSFPTN
ncbi:unnamed protein product [Brassica oleracea]